MRELFDVVRPAAGDGPPGTPACAMMDAAIAEFLADPPIPPGAIAPMTLDEGEPCPVCGADPPCEHYPDVDDGEDVEPVEDLASDRYQRWLGRQLDGVAHRYFAVAQRLSTMPMAPERLDEVLFKARVLAVLANAAQWAGDLAPLRDLNRVARDHLERVPVGNARVDFDSLRESAPQQAALMRHAAQRLKDTRELYSPNEAAIVFVLTIIRKPQLLGVRRKLGNGFLTKPFAQLAALEDAIANGRASDLDVEWLARGLLKVLGYPKVRSFFDAGRKDDDRKDARAAARPRTERRD